MGSDIDNIKFAPEDYRRFQSRLEGNLQQLQVLLQDPEFGTGPSSLGAELEMYIVDANGRPLSLNQELLEDAGDPQLTLELNRYNLEYNLTPRPLADRPFARTERELLDKLGNLRKLAAKRGGRIVIIGILPTLHQADFGPECMTDRGRYHALVAQLIKRRGSDFNIDINGVEPLQLDMAGITLEGANTSFQVHYRVPPADYAQTFNAIQMTTPLAVAIAANSPTLFGHRLWHETRIPLFKQSIDTRVRDRYGWNEPSRVNFGHGWVREGALELFAETVRLYPPLLPVNYAAQPGENAAAPALAELQLHQSTVWLWNRPVYDAADGGHLRIEMRSLPAGPTPVDMVANAAFMIGVAEGIRPQLDKWLPGLPFHLAEYNLYRAAQYGLGAKLVWPYPGQTGFREQTVHDIIKQLLPLAHEGLAKIGIASSDAGRYLEVIEQRLASGQTGAVWQREQLAKLTTEMTLEDALHEMLERFISHSVSNRPVAEWPL